MEVTAKPDFSGWATKVGIKCADGRTIMSDAFKHQDATTVPLVWQHGHDDPTNVLGHALLENREDGVYAHAYFNDTPAAQHAKTLVEHKDITSLSIWANQLTERSKQVLHGVIRELSLVLSGANPGALIDNISLRHGEGNFETLNDEAIIYTGLELIHSDESAGEGEGEGEGAGEGEGEGAGEGAGESAGEGAGEGAGEVEHSAEDPTVQEVYDSMNEDQQNVVNYMIATALDEAAAEHSALEEGEQVHPALAHANNNNEEGQHMKRNVFEQRKGEGEVTHELTHDAIQGIIADAKKKSSLKDALADYALAHGITDIDVLFPDARNIQDTPEFDQRRIEWVAGVLTGTRHTPFSRIKSIVADITFDEARAKGYVKGNLKKEEFFSVSKRITTPSTVYKKQQLDRDDIIDITDFDVVTWLWGEMRLMLEEELARAILIGDGRDVDDDDKIRDPSSITEGSGIRSILNDHDLYAATVTVDDTATNTAIVDAITSAMGFYKGSGSPTWYTTLPFLTQLLTTRDEFGHRMWKTKQELAGEIGVNEIVPVDVMEDEDNLLGIIVNLRDYTIGTDAGGDITKFDDFDIDYNQYKYLLETRLSGALTKIRSALVVMKAADGAAPVVPTEPTFDGTTVTIPSVSHVTYKNADGDGTVTGTIVLDEGESVHIYTVASAGYYFANNVEDEWTFTNNASA